jgi:hypothetical protein
MKNTSRNLRSALGLAILPTLLLSAFGAGDSIAVSVLLSCWVTTFVAMQFPD